MQLRRDLGVGPAGGRGDQDLFLAGRERIDRLDRCAAGRWFGERGQQPCGDALIAPKITARLLAAFSEPPKGRTPVQPVDPLTTREEQVLIAAATGRTNAEIAAELHISLSTVKTHLTSVMGKVGARNRVEVAMWAYETGRIKV